VLQDSADYSHKILLTEFPINMSYVLKSGDPGGQIL
jgi:hypothetical protein